MKRKGFRRSLATLVPLLSKSSLRSVGGVLHRHLGPENHPEQEPSVMAVSKPKTASVKKSETATVAAKPATPAAKAKASIDQEVRRRMIAEAAYYIAEKRGFIHGHHDADWAAAERQIDALLAK
jgi:hypothetical protein